MIPVGCIAVDKVPAKNVYIIMMILSFSPTRILKVFITLDTFETNVLLLRKPTTAYPLATV
jgi:hypothetical protein